MTRQNRITAGGDVAGGNIVRQQVTVLTSQEPLLLKRLFERYHADVETQTTTDKLIAELRAYIPDEDVGSLERDLERKLREAGREDLVRQARRYKEIFRQKIEKYCLFPAAQAIYAYLLGEILTRFDAYVRPAIDEGADHREVGKLIHECVVQSVINAIPDSEPSCDHPSLYGMIYFLTGNCFIEW